MPRPRKEQSSGADTAKKRDIENYTHDDKARINNPPAGMAQHDKAAEKVKTYQFDPHLSPTLQWAGKAEGVSFDVPTSSIHIHETITPYSIISRVTKEYSETPAGQVEGQMALFAPETPAERMRRKLESLAFYQHDVKWKNRLIAGDSLIVMNSLLEKEGMAGQVQMVYFDPPYGISYGSNFQPFVNQKDVRDRKDDDLSQEPEIIKAFRDTWENGIHSYLSYLRTRLKLIRELLSDSGSIFIQINDENLHYVRNICDEIFGPENFVSTITFQTKVPLRNKYIANVSDYIIWYAKDFSASFKYRAIFEDQKLSESSQFNLVELPDGTIRSITKEERKRPALFPSGSKVFTSLDLSSSGRTESCVFDYTFDGKTYSPTQGKSWKTNREGMQRLEQAGRLYATANSLRYKLYHEDFPVKGITNLWNDSVGVSGKIYVVQTDTKPIQRCMLMTTDPGDLVLDITCGSGTTAYVAEQWGRRWITCDTSRVAITLAKQRLLTATFDYYKLAHENQGVSSGFLYKTVPHITIKSIAQNEPSASETLYDQPEIDKSKVRITGPFTVEALPAPVVKPLDETDGWDEDASAKQVDWREQLRATGILGQGGKRLEFSRVEPLSGTKFLQAEAETKEDTPRRAVICFAGESKPLDARMVEMALNEAESLRPAPKLIIFAAFQFDPVAAKNIANTNWAGMTLLQAQMNTDLMTEDLKKKRSSDQSYWLVGQPDVELIPDKRSKTRYKVKVHGFDYYDVKKGRMDRSEGPDKIAMWMLDTDYDSMCIKPEQIFFPMGGSKGGWNKLAKELRAEIDRNLIEKYAGTESLWFTAQPNSLIAVKIIDDRGIESMKVIKVGGE